MDVRPSFPAVSLIRRLGLRARRIIVGSLACLLVATALFAAGGCDTAAVDDDLALILNFEPFETVVSGQITDARTLAPVEDVPVTVRFVGPNAGRVVDVDGGPVSEIRLQEVSLLSFGLDGTAPTPDAPVELLLNVTADGYLETSQRVVVAGSEQTFSLSLVRLDDLPDGVTTAVEQFAAPGGTVFETVVVATPPEAATRAGARLTLPAGTQIRDENGAPLSGTLTARVTYFSNRSNAARAAFPGGFTGVQIDRDEDGADARGTFITAGFAAITVRDDFGREGESFSEPIGIQIDVPEGTDNPETGRPIRAGDAVPVYSFDEDTGAWTFEARAPAQIVARTANRTEPVTSSGLPRVAIETSHLSYWNLDFLYPDLCAVAAPFVFDGLPFGFYRWSLERRADGGVLQAGELYDGAIQFFNAPRDLPATLRLTDSDGDEIVSADVDDICAGGTIDVPGGGGEPGRRVTVEAQIAVTCPSDDLEIRPSNVILWYRPETGRRWTRAVLRNGRIVLPGLIDGSSYVVGLWLDDAWEFETMLLDLDGIDDDNVDVTRRDETTYEVEVRYVDDDGFLCD